MPLVDSIDELISLAQQIHTLVLPLSQVADFTDEQRADIQTLTGAVKRFLDVVLSARRDHTEEYTLMVLFNECRIPLNTLIGYSELFVRGVLGAVPDPHYETLVKINQGSLFILEKINDLLDAYRKK